MRRVVRITPGLLFSLSLLAGTLAAPAQAQTLDHYNVYLAFSPSPPAASQPVTVTDQFGTVTTVLDVADLFLVPAEKNGEVILDPFSHLTCYQAPDPQIPPAQVIATHQFGQQLLNLGPSNRLCVPTEKLSDPGPVSLDHYFCYPATGNPLQATAQIRDQFQLQSVVLFDPFMFCNPAEKNGEAIQNSEDHLACYMYTPPGQGANAPIANQFFPAGVSATFEVANALCLPAKKEVVVPPPDHFTVYKVRQPSPDGPLVQLDDQWQSQTTDLGNIELFMVPADKNFEGIEDEVSHLACNKIVDGDPGPPQVWAINQFGQQQLSIGQPTELCAPTEKPQFTPGIVDLDHYKCYEAFGSPLNVTIGYADQFTPDGTGLLLEPFRFCNPVDKNGEGIDKPDDHLACFYLDPPLPGPTFPIDILNQFSPPTGGTDIIQLEERFAFCLPSCKDSDGDGDCDEDDNCPNVPLPSPDSDGDGIGDLCDPCIFFDNSIPGGLVDTDGDQIPDVCQCCDANMNGFLDNGDLTTIFQCITGTLPPATCAAILASGKGTCNNNGLFDNNDLSQLFQVLTFVNPSSVLTCPNRPEGTPVP